MNIVSQCREQARRVYSGAIFEIEREISAYSPAAEIMVLVSKH